MPWSSDGVAVHSDSSDPRKRSAIQGRAGIQRDGLVGHDSSLENRGGAERGRCADLPKDIGGLRVSNQENLAVGGRGQGGGDLEDPDCIDVAAAIEGEIARGNLQGAGRFIKTGRQRLAAEIPSNRDWRGGAPLRVVVSHSQGSLGLRGRWVGGINPAVDDPRRKAGNSRAGGKANVAIHRGGMDAGNRGAGQDGVITRGA